MAHGKRGGHTSLNGIVSLTSIDTGKVLDIHAMSKFCQCPKRSIKERLDLCTANYLGTSEGMEVSGAVKIFGRTQIT